MTELTKSQEFDTKHQDSEIVCPHCGERWNPDAEEIQACLSSRTDQCPKCEKEFWVEGEAVAYFSTFKSRTDAPSWI